MEGWENHRGPCTATHDFLKVSWPIVAGNKAVDSKLAATQYFKEPQKNKNSKWPFR